MVYSRKASPFERMLPVGWFLPAWQLPQCQRRQFAAFQEISGGSTCCACRALNGVYKQRVKPKSIRNAVSAEGRRKRFYFCLTFGEPSLRITASKALLERSH